MTLKIKSAEDIDLEKATYLIYGSQGVGKTSSLKHLPGKTLVIPIDQSESVLVGEKNIDIAEIDSSEMWESWNTTVTELITNPIYEQTYDNIVVDNVSELFRSSLENLGKHGKASQQGVPSMADYQKVDFLVMRMLRALKKLDVRLVITAWDVLVPFESESGQTFTRKIPDLRKGVQNNFLGLCDVVAYLTVSQREEGVVRGFVLQPTNDVVAKNRLDDRKGCLVSELVVKEGVDDGNMETS